MASTQRKDLRAAAAARGEALCALVPTLRMAAVGLTRRADEAEDLVHDILLQGLILGGRWDRRELLPHLLSRMRNTFYTRTPLAGWTCPEAHDAPEDAGLAAQVYALPAPEREAVILVALLGASVEQACGLCGCTQEVLRSRIERGQGRLGASDAAAVSRARNPAPAWMTA